MPFADDNLSRYRIEAVKVAYDFHYGKKVINKIKEADSIGEISKIMREARIKKFKDY